MTYFIAILCGLLTGAALGFGLGLAAATKFTEMYGSNSGGSAMGGFFFVGPFGLVAGLLLGSGLYLRLAQGGGTLNNGLLWGGGIVLAMGLLVFLVPVYRMWSEENARAKFDLQLEFEVPASSDSALALDQYKWGYAGHSPEELADSPFYEKSCGGGVCVLSSAIQMVDFPDRRLAIFGHEGQVEKFPIPITGAVTAPTEWSTWQAGGGVRFRWMMKTAK